MNTRQRWALAAVGTVLVLAAGCSDDPLDPPAGSTSSTEEDGGVATVPDRPPEVTGTLRVDGPPAAPAYRLEVTSAADSYYADASLTIDDTSVLVDGATGQALEEGDLVDGLPVEVWVGACRESFPVGCDVEALRAIV